MEKTFNTVLEKTGESIRTGNYKMIEVITFEIPGKAKGDPAQECYWSYISYFSHRSQLLTDKPVPCLPGHPAGWP